MHPGLLFLITTPNNSSGVPQLPRKISIQKRFFKKILCLFKKIITLNVQDEEIAQNLFMETADEKLKVFLVSRIIAKHDLW